MCLFASIFYALWIGQVGMRITPDRIVKMDIEEQALTLILQEDLFWIDESLQWERNSSFLIQDVFLNSSDIWWVHWIKLASNTQPKPLLAFLSGKQRKLFVVFLADGNRSKIFVYV